MGPPIGHTKSPIFQQPRLADLVIDETFETSDVLPEHLEAKVATFRDIAFIAP